MLFQLLQAAGIDTIAAAQAASMPVVPHQEEIHLLDMAFKGGWLMLVLLALSIVAIYLFGKKWWMIHQAGQIDNNFMRDIRDYIHEGKLKSAQLQTRMDASHLPFQTLLPTRLTISTLISWE
mgnify:CR=1 FL=1